MHSPRMTLDNPVLASRRRTTIARRSTYERRALLPTRVHRGVISDIAPAKPAAKKVKPASQAHLPRHSRSQVLKREGVRQGGVRRRKHASLKSKVLTGMAVLLFVFGLGVGIMGVRGNHKVEAQVQHLASQAVAGESTAAPNEQKPTSINDYHVAAALPRVLRIAKLGVEARIVRTTVNAKNELGSPANIFDSAWYDGSSRPGESGAMLIDGHVSGPTQNGVFYNLKKLKVGDKIDVERGDGKHFNYTVSASKVYEADNVDMGAAFTPITPGRPGLNLITCTGKVDGSGDHFTQRLIVFATQD